jgi:hypothetical protein
VAGARAWLEAAQDDATRLAIGDMERAGIDIITDGEIRRESYSNRFATALSGVDLDNPAIRELRPNREPACRDMDRPSGHRKRALAYLDDAFSIRDERGASIAVDRGIRPRYWYFCQGTALFLAVADIRRASRRTSFASRRR